MDSYKLLSTDSPFTDVYECSKLADLVEHTISPSGLSQSRKGKEG